MAKKKKADKKTVSSEVKIERKPVFELSGLWTDVLVLVLVLLFCLAVWWPTRFLPYHWDGASFVINAARDLVARNFNPPALLEFKTAHQPGFMIMLGVMWKMFGENRLVTHILMLPSLPLLMFSTYLVGKKLYSQKLGIVASFLVGVLPLAVSEYGMVSVELWMTALATLALALWVMDKKTIGVLVLSLAILVKGAAILMVLPMFWISWTAAEDKKNFDFKLYLLPVAVLMGWFVYHLSITGWLFAPPEIPLILPNSMNMFVKYLVFVLQNVLGSHMRWVLTVPAIVGLVFMWSSKKLSGNEYVSAKGLLAALMTGVVYLAIRGGFTEPASLILMPSLIIVCLWFIEKGFEKFDWFGSETNLALAGTIILLVFLTAWQPKTEAAKEYVFTRSADLSYQDMIYVGRAAAVFTQVNFPGTKIYGGYPEYYQLTEPYQGYVSKALDFDTCDHFDGKSEKPVLIYLHPYHPSQQNCRILLDQYKLQPVKRFENNGAWVEIYAYGASESAELKDSTNN